MGIHEDLSQGFLHDLDLNGRWISTEVIHSVNNFLGGVEYSIHFIREDPGSVLESNLNTIQDRVEDISKILKSLYELQNPLAMDHQIAYSGLFERIRCLLTKQIHSQGIDFSVVSSDHLYVPAKQERFLSQLLFTYLWLRLKHIENPCLFQLLAQEEEGKVWISVSDNGLVDPAMGIFESARKDVETPQFSTRKEFAKHCLGRFVCYLKAKGCRPVFKNGLFKFQSIQEFQ